MTESIEDPSTPEVVDNDAHDRLEMVDRDQRAVLEYRVEDDQLILIHTEVPDSMAGKGIGGDLVRAAVTKAAREDQRLISECAFASRWIDEHASEVAEIQRSAS